MDPENKKRISIYMDKNIVEKADKALYWAKEHGRNQVGRNEE